MTSSRWRRLIWPERMEYSLEEIKPGLYVYVYREGSMSDLMSAEDLAATMYHEIFLHEAVDPYAACRDYAQLLLDLREALTDLHGNLHEQDCPCSPLLARADALLVRGK